MHAKKHTGRESGDPTVRPPVGIRCGPCCESKGNNTAMNGCGKSDRRVVPEKSANKDAGQSVSAEHMYLQSQVQMMEERRLAKGNQQEQTRHRTQSRERLQQKLVQIRQIAEKDKEAKFTALWHHVYDIDRLREAYYGLKRKSAKGVDGMSWEQYGENLEENLLDLSDRLKRGAYHARPVRRVYIPKPDGRQRPIGIPALEDKIVQGATTEVLNAIYEADFKDFSYGFRPGRNQHNALDALTVGIEKGEVSWVLDADIRSFFDTIDHDWLLRFIEHRIVDKRVLRHIKKWLLAGVLEDGKVTQAEAGTPQGGSISPLLANIYLHYAMDKWADQWRNKKAQGEVYIVRFADDAVFCFQYRSDGENFLAEMRRNLSRFGLELHPEKTRLIEFGSFAASTRAKRNEKKPETFDFLGFTHICSTTRKGKFCVLRKTKSKKMRAKLKEMHIELRKRMHDPIPEVGKWLRSVLTGHYNYYGVPRNTPALYSFHKEVIRLWMLVLKNRSQKNRVTWKRMGRLIALWLPRPTIKHLYPGQRLSVMT
jgi:RNA-directed DNA polymerase